MGNKGRINFRQYDKVLVQSCVQYYQEYWKRRCVVLHNPEVQIKVSKDEALNILEEESKEEVEGLKRHVEVPTMNVNNVSVDGIFLWVRGVRACKRRDGKSVPQDMRNILNLGMI